MRRGATTCFSIIALLLAICLGMGNSTIPSVSAGELIMKGAAPSPGDGGGAAPLGGGGGTGTPGGMGGALDSGDDDDYWDGVNNDEEPPRSHPGLPLLLHILETWWESESWIVP